jgi:vanillate O-demethylase monooxygenase subunit
MQYSGGVNAGGYDAGIREGGHNVRTLHAITPETEKSCFYFFNKADGYARFEPADTVRTWASTTDVFKEDAFMLEQQQLRLNNYDTNKLLNINTDVARVQMIRALNERLQRERDFAATG